MITDKDIEIAARKDEPYKPEGHYHGFRDGVRWALSQPQKPVLNDEIRSKAKDFSILYAHEFGALHCQIEEDLVKIAKWVRDHYESQSVSQPQWIDVKTKWPDHNSWVMVWWPDRSTSPKVALQHYLIGNSVTWTHWQPLPEGPKP
jgi:hypothetical protein